MSHKIAHRWTRSVALHPRCSCGWQAEEAVDGTNKVHAYTTADQAHQEHADTAEQDTR